MRQSLLAADQPLLTHEAEPDRELSTAFELLRISDGRDYGACRSRPKARDTLQVTACLNPMPCQQFYVDILDPFGVAAPQGPVFADLLPVQEEQAAVQYYGGLVKLRCRVRRKARE
jgi:hypothetical protein